MVPGCQSTGDNIMFFKKLSELAKHSCRNWGHGRNVCEEKQKEQRSKGNFDTFTSEEFFVLLPTSATSPGYSPRMSFYRWNSFLIAMKLVNPPFLSTLRSQKKHAKRNHRSKDRKEISESWYLHDRWKTLEFKTLKNPRGTLYNLLGLILRATSDTCKWSRI